MAVEFGDLWPQGSGTSSLGAEMTNGDFTGDIRPYAHVHMNSGIFHEPLTGASGVIRYRKDNLTAFVPFGILPAQGFELSFDGGASYGLGFGREPLNGFNVIYTPNNIRTQVRSSGLSIFSIGSIDVSSYESDINFLANSHANIAFQADGKVSLISTLAAGNPLLSNGVDFTTHYSNMRFQAGLLGSNYGDILLSAWASSGQLKYNFGQHQSWYIKTSHASTGGPFNDGFWPIAHSGNISQLLNQVVLGVGSGLQQTYDASREATLLLPNNLNALGLLFKLRNGTRNSLPTDPRGFVPTYGVAVSGFSATPTNQHSYGVAFLGHNALSFQGSGTSQSNLWLGINPVTGLGTVTSSGILTITGSGININSQGFISYGSTGNQILTVGGVFAVSAQGQISLSSANSASLSAPTVVFTATNDMSLQAQGGPLNLETVNDNHDISLNSTGDFILHAHNHSGQMGYRFGPYESWHQFNSAGGGTASFQPIPHSGHINQMIQSARTDIGSGLQRAYNAGRTVVLNSAIGDLQLISNTAKAKFAGTTLAPLNLSGVFTRPTVTLEMGDMYSMAHSAMEDLGVNTQATTQAIASAKALGLATPVFNTGSGIVNFALSSGVMQCVNNGAQTITTAFTDVNLNTITATADQNYTLSATPGSGVITVMSPGLYKISYKVAFAKTVGTLPQTAEVKLVVNNDGIAVLGSVIDAFMFDAVNAAKSSGGTVIFQNLNAGDNLRLQANSTLAGANNCQIMNRGAIFCIEKLGSKRGVF